MPDLTCEKAKINLQRPLYNSFSRLLFTTANNKDKLTNSVHYAKCVLLVLSRSNRLKGEHSSRRLSKLLTPYLLDSFHPSFVGITRSRTSLLLLLHLPHYSRCTCLVTLGAAASLLSVQLPHYWRCSCLGIGGGLHLVSLFLKGKKGEGALSPATTRSARNLPGTASSTMRKALE